MNQTEEEINKALNKKMGLEDTLEQVSNETVVINKHNVLWFPIAKEWIFNKIRKMRGISLT